MTKNVISAYKNWNLIDCITALSVGKFRHLPVLAGEESPAIAIGMVSSRDVMKHLVYAVENANDSELVANVGLNDVFNKICRKGARTCYVKSTDTVLIALEELFKQNLGALFVYEGTEIVGIFTERDYLNKVILQGRFSKDTAVSEVMTKDPLTAGPQDSAIETLKLMVSHNIRNIPVIPMLGQSIDYGDGKEYSTIGMLNEVDFIKYSFTKIKESNKN